MALELQQWIGKANIADQFTDDELNRLGAQVVEDWRIDLESRADWEKRTQAGLDLAMQIMTTKSWPWEKAANVKYPLIAYAAIQFHARAYPEIIRGNDVVKGKVVGRDETGEKQQRGERVSKFMSYQLLEEMEEWEEDTDRLLIMLPIIGTLFKKTYFDTTRQRPVSCLRKPLDIVVHNDAKSLDDSRRITDQGVYLYRNDIFERVASGLFVDEELHYEFEAEKQQPEQFLEQHLWFDLDKDGYDEPYIVTVHRYSSKVVRVYPRYDEDSVIVTPSGKLAKINPLQYFTKFSFLPSFDGSFYDIGFGQLLMPLNESINSVLNQLLDAGTLANVQGGLISRGIKVKGGRYQFQPGEWKQTDASPQELKDGFFPLPVKEPSAVLFTLLSLLIDTGKQLSSVADVMSGEQAGPNEPVGTMLARIEQGLKVFSGIHKRIYRSLKAEYKKIAKIDYDYMDDEYYYRVMDIENIAFRKDFAPGALDIVPVADPAQGTDTQRLAKAQALMEVNGAPGVNGWQVTRRYLEAIKIDNIDEIQPQETKDQPAPPDPKMIELQGKMQIEAEKLKLQVEKQDAEIEKLHEEIGNISADTMYKLAQTEAVQLGPQLEYYKQFADRLSQENEELKRPKVPEMETQDDQIGVLGVEEPVSNGGGVQIPEGLPAGMGAEVSAEEFNGGNISGGIDQGGGLVGD